MPDNSSKIAFLFPGQGSQALGMGQLLADQFPVAAETFQEADQILGINLSQIAWQGPQAALDDTLNTQPALMVHSIAALRILNQTHPQLQPAAVAGHSMGELSALVAAGSLEFAEGLHLVRRRGQLMKEAGEISPGGMAAVLGLDIEQLEEICTSATQESQVVQIANDNCPGQVVISGSDPALERAMKLASDAGARRVIRLAVSIAAHSPLMLHAQDRFSQVVETSRLKHPAIPIIGNVHAKPLLTRSEIQADLRAQLNSRVRWTESMRYLLSTGITTFIEIGTGPVLTGLLKRIDRSLKSFAVGDPEDFEKLPPV